MVKFFRMSQKGEIKRPTLAAVGATMVAAVLTLMALYEHPIFAIIAWLLEYLFFAVVLANPFRVTLGKLMHVTRNPSIMSIPAEADKEWIDANKPAFIKTGLKLYTGEKFVSSKNDKNKDVDLDLDDGHYNENA